MHNRQKKFSIMWAALSETCTREIAGRPAQCTAGTVSSSSGGQARLMLCTTHLAAYISACWRK